MREAHHALTLNAYDKLRGLRQGKTNVRRIIDDFLVKLLASPTGDLGKAAQVAQAAEIREQILAINQNISMVETSLRSYG